MMDAVHDPILQEKLTPNYPVGCKRITFSKTYYPAMSLSNVFLNREEIVEVNEETIVTADGKRQKLDVIVDFSSITLSIRLTSLTLTALFLVISTV
jgi:cation diffusion facilitator CzcD-associated flavoprotein CzcO